MKINIFLIITVFTLLLYACNNQQKIDSKEINIANSTTPNNSIPLTVKMVYIPGGEYKPFYGSDSTLVKVPAFLLDERAVTNQEFLAFIKLNPAWRKSVIKRIYADTSYLNNWVNDTTLPKDAKLDAPITNISWFAAKAFAKSIGKRLPTLDEWEYVAMADKTTANARSKPTYSNEILDLYLQKNRQYNAVKQSAPNYWGVYNMFDLIWEWTDDFNSVLTTGDSRSGQYDDKNLFCAASATSATDIMNYAAFMRFALRGSVKANFAIANLGFRCAKDTLILNK
ncbi:MAG TPA: formylglycine-generating enzyme family protein [Chitinophagaceae bacterium]|nr:formylglycine-generating enzyme family protein [Chitinophagaceae bacterium]HNM35003.1 formylglycine-generating enzyme family protein [Chitinophagaceae bacterium]